MLSSIIPKRQVHTKINEKVKKAIYNMILQHSQVVKPPIANYCIKVSIDGHYEHTVVSKIIITSVCQRTLQ